jgi:hypothetical protein
MAIKSRQLNYIIGKHFTLLDLHPRYTPQMQVHVQTVQPEKAQIQKTEPMPLSSMMVGIN